MLRPCWHDSRGLRSSTESRSPDWAAGEWGAETGSRRWQVLISGRQKPCLFPLLRSKLLSSSAWLTMHAAPAPLQPEFLPEVLLDARFPKMSTVDCWSRWAEWNLQFPRGWHCGIRGLLWVWKLCLEGEQFALGDKNGSHQDQRKAKGKELAKWLATRYTPLSHTRTYWWSGWFSLLSWDMHYGETLLQDRGV